MDEAEKRATEEFVAASNKLRADGFKELVYISRLTPEELTHTGHKTLESALLSQIKYNLKQLEKLEKEFLKKYPD